MILTQNWYLIKIVTRTTSKNILEYLKMETEEYLKIPCTPGSRNCRISFLNWHLNTIQCSTWIRYFLFPPQNFIRILLPVSFYFLHGRLLKKPSNCSHVFCYLIYDLAPFLTATTHKNTLASYRRIFKNNFSLEMGHRSSR